MDKLFKNFFSRNSRGISKRRNQKNKNVNIYNTPKRVRYWENCGEQYKPSVENVSTSFTVMSYNILAQNQLHTHNSLYTQCFQHCLNWNYRSKAIIKEIIFISPDIICLQEMQENHLEDLSSQLNVKGFEYIYKKRTRDQTDGCAIFYKSSLLNLIKHHTVEYFQPSVYSLNRDHIGLLAMFTLNTCPGAPIVVCTTHLLYNPKRTDVRLCQLRVLLAEIDRFTCNENASVREYFPTILTGDFNSVPDSPVTKLIMCGQIPNSDVSKTLTNIGITDDCQHLGIYLQSKSVEIKNEETSMLCHSDICNKKNREKLIKHVNTHKALFNKKNHKHKLNFRSVYNIDSETNELQIASAFQNSWVIVDYIFYNSINSDCKLELVQRFRLPTIQECSQLGPLPSKTNGSDHYSLVARFTLCINEKPKIAQSNQSGLNII